LEHHQVKCALQEIEFGLGHCRLLLLKCHMSMTRGFVACLPGAAEHLSYR
jgi:hypothetical protein